jgi:hypothetical protein
VPYRADSGRAGVYYPKSLGLWRLTPHGSTNPAIIQSSAFLALINSDPRPEFLYEGRTMAQAANLEARILGLCSEANAMLLANLLDTKKAVVLRRRLLECADHAREACHTDGETRVRRAEADLAARFSVADA